MDEFDVIVIGSGPAGEKAAIEAASLGAKVAVVEKNAQPGGASLITGTIPSKAIRETVQFVRNLNQKGVNGVDLALGRQVHIEELMHRKNVVLAERAEEILLSYQRAGIEYIRGEASFLGENEIRVRPANGPGNEHLLSGKRIILAAGTRPYHPDDVPFDGCRILDSDSILNLKEVPASMCIIGGGVIGCEYASIFSHLGTRVYLVDPRGVLLDFMDREISGALAYLMQSSGVTLRLGERHSQITLEGDQVLTLLKSGKQIRSEVLLYANGRQGTADRLHLEACGLEMNGRNQLEVNECYQTQVPHIYAVGDLIGFPSLVSTGNEQGRQAAMHACTGQGGADPEERLPYGIYTIPEIAMVGATEEQLTKEEIPYEVGVCQLRTLARAKMMGEDSGLLKLLFHRETLELLGVHVIGPSASEMIHVGQAVMHFRGTVDYFVGRVMNFPTLSSAYKVAAHDGLSRLGRRAKPGCVDAGPLKMVG